jgi:cytochrome c oxidase subunit 2
VFDVYVPIALGVLALFLIATVALVVKNRRRPAAEASRRESNERLEGSYAALLVCVVAFLLYLTFSAEHRTDTVAARERPALSIAVTAAKWEWTFRYPAYGITILSGTTGQRTVVVPAGEAVRFSLTSADVIHAFWIPELRFKHDLIHGRTQDVTLTFTRQGLFSGQCAEFCGLRHDDMVYAFRVVAPSRFQAWARSGGKAPA